MSVRQRYQVARNGTLILGGGFAGAHVARLLGHPGATIISPESAMLYTPLLPEVAAGAIEPRHAFVPLRMMCPHADLVRGWARSLDCEARTVTVDTGLGAVEVGYERLIVALGSTARMLPIPGLAEHTITFKNLADAIQLRNHVMRRLDLAEADPSGATRHLSFVFVGAGYAGVEALAEMKQLVHDALRYYPLLQNVRQRWILVDAGPSILAEVPRQLADFTAGHLRGVGVEILSSTTMSSVAEGSITLSDGAVIPTETVVWTAGVTANPLVADLGLPLDERGRICVDSRLQVEGRSDIWALGDAARVPNEATPGRFDPPTCQHALRQARTLADGLRGNPRPHDYRSIGEGATLGRDVGIARVLGLHLRGRLGAFVTRMYHVQAVPVVSRRFRILTDGILSMLFRRDITELSSLEAAPRVPEVATRSQRP